IRTVPNSLRLKISFSRGPFAQFWQPVLSPGISHSTPSSLPRCPRYNGVMRYKLMLLGVFVLFRMSGCNQHPLTDYRPLDQARMWASNVEQLKKLNTSGTQVALLVKLKQAGIRDHACVTLVAEAHKRHHAFPSGDYAV